MWLPTKDERGLLVHYYKRIKRPNEWYTFEIWREDNEFIPSMNEKTNNCLVDWKLIEVEYQTDEWRVKLTDKGWELGRKYARSLDRIGLWCAAQEHQWLWYIITLTIGTIGGVAGTIFVQWFCGKYLPGQQGKSGLHIFSKGDHFLKLATVVARLGCGGIEKEKLKQEKNKAVKVLDCESIESTYKSLEDILGVKEFDLCQLFDSIAIYEQMHESTCNFLFSYIRDKTHCKPHFDKACWFHATRTWPENTYDDGLLPLNQAIDKIWDFLFELAKEQITAQEWRDFRNFMDSGSGNNYAYLYRMKLNNAKIHGGPVAFLVKQIAFVRNSSYVNYFDCPEIVEDICNNCSKTNLMKLYQSNTVRCIVKFVDQWAPTTKAWTPEKALSTALLYVYHDHHGLELDYGGELTYTFDGKGTPVPKDRILKVEFPS